jgi:ankyrin repeat protein
MKDIAEIYKKCETTGAWYSVKISNFSQRNMLGDTVLHTVCSWGDVDAVKTLVLAGADVNAKGDMGGTPLFNAVIGRSAQVVDFLLKSGADPNIANDYGRLVVNYAKNVSAPLEIIRLLEKASFKKKQK